MILADFWSIRFYKASALLVARSKHYLPSSWQSCFHGHRSRGGGDAGDKSPKNLEWKTLMQIAPPPQILSCRYKKEHSVAFKIRQNLFSAGALPWTSLGGGSSRRSPRPSSLLGRGHPSPYPTPLGTDPPSALASRSPARSTPMLVSRLHNHYGQVYQDGLARCRSGTDRFITTAWLHNNC